MSDKNITINSTWYLWHGGQRQGEKFDLEIPVSLGKRGTNFAIAEASPTEEQLKEILDSRDLPSLNFSIKYSSHNEVCGEAGAMKYHFECVSHMSLSPIETYEIRRQQ